MLLYMSYSNCHYLFLHEAQRDGTTWSNLPTLQSSRRECYITIIDCKLAFDSTQSHESVNLKMVIPTLNYTSSSNDSPIVSVLNTANKKLFDMQHTNEIHILTNDALKKCEFILEDNDGNVLTIDPDDSLEIMIKIDYVDQDKQTESYLSDIPKHLGGL